MEVAKAGRGRGREDQAAIDLPGQIDRAASYAPLYLTSALGRVSFDIEDLQELALSRLQLLKSAGDANGPSAAPAAESTSDVLRRVERDTGFWIPPLGNEDREDSILRDEAAHFLLRLALCRSFEERAWFLSRECTLFGMRLERAGTNYALDKIKAADGPDIKPVPVETMKDIAPDLDAVARGVRRQANDFGNKYYEVAFEHVPGLVRNRRVFMRDGVAFVPDQNVRDIVAAQFRAKLNHALITASKAVGLAEQDPRMRTILDAVRARHAAEESGRLDFEDGRGVDKISLNQLLESLPAMPLCQQNLMQRLGDDHHLRHAGRMQLGVFLKGCGLTMDESLRFWRTEFTKGGMPSDKFDKNYAYNIRHHYGKEGKRKNLAPFACIRIINERPGPGEHHGCPYREFPHNRLKDALRRNGASEPAIMQIIASSKDGNYQAACGSCFASTQPGHHEKTESGHPVFFPSHPNEYFIEARSRRVAPEPAAPVEDAMDDVDMPAAGEKGDHPAATQNETQTPVKKNVAMDDGDGDAPATKRTKLTTADSTANAGKEAENMPDADTELASTPVALVSNDTAVKDIEGEAVAQGVALPGEPPAEDNAKEPDSATGASCQEPDAMVEAETTEAHSEKANGSANGSAKPAEPEDMKDVTPAATGAESTAPLADPAHATGEVEQPIAEAAAQDT